MRRDRERRARAEAAGEGAMDEEETAEEVDEVPHITRAHFEEAFGFARRSVSDAELRRYEQFAASMSASRGAQGSNFKFPDAENAGEAGQAGAFGNEADDDDLYA